MKIDIVSEITGLTKEEIENFKQFFNLFLISKYHKKELIVIKMYIITKSLNNIMGDNMKKILITGARSGIMGKVIDKIKNNYFIYVTVHTQSQLKAIKEKYKNNKNIKCFKLDVTNQKDILKLKNLDIDILISNAAISETGSILELPIEKMKNNFQTNVFSNFNIIQIVLKNMIKKNKKDTEQDLAFKK